MIHPRKFVDLNGFLMTLEEFPVILASNSVKALVELWNGEIIRRVDTISPKIPFYRTDPY